MNIPVINLGWIFTQGEVVAGDGAVGVAAISEQKDHHHLKQ